MPYFVPSLSRRPDPLRGDYLNRIFMLGDITNVRYLNSVTHQILPCFIKETRNPSTIETLRHTHISLVAKLFSSGNAPNQRKNTYMFFFFPALIFFIN